jgi:hypothetical protein
MHAPDDNPPPFPPIRWGLAGLRTEAAPEFRWLWHGYLAARVVTLLTSQWKTGKTTLTAVLLSHMKNGGTLAGLPLAAGRAVILSEESSETWLLHWRVLEALFRRADHKLSRADLFDGWPAEERPDSATLYRWLRRAVEQGLLRQDGLGKCKEPFRYWLPESEARWRENPLARILMPELFRSPSPR